MLEPKLKQLLDRLGVSEEVIVDFCHRHQITEFSLFGSALRDDFRPDSDVDVIVDFEKGAARRLWGQASLQEELEKIFKRKVDVLPRRGVEGMRNKYRRQNILAGQKRIFE